jgi:two-component system, sensor histidine kinase and response regulator
VGNGREALDVLAQQPFDLVLMDVQMPEMDGFEATAAIRAHEQQSGMHIPIIAMTAHALQGDRERCLAVGIDDYVSKPMKAVDLYATIDRLLQQAPAPHRPAAETPINLATVLSNVDEDKTLLADMLEVFLQDYPKQLVELREAINSGDAARTAHAAHSLKGAIGYFGAQTAHTLAYELETRGRRAELDGAAAVLQQLERELERIVAFIAEPGWEERI